MCCDIHYTRRLALALRCHLPPYQELNPLPVVIRKEKMSDLDLEDCKKVGLMFPSTTLQP